MAKSSSPKNSSAKNSAKNSSASKTAVVKGTQAAVSSGSKAPSFRGDLVAACKNQLTPPKSRAARPVSRIGQRDKAKNADRVADSFGDEMSAKIAALYMTKKSKSPNVKSPEA